MKSQDSGQPKVSFFGLYRYASVCTVLTALLGMVCGVISGFLWPILFYKMGDAYMAMQDLMSGPAQLYDNTIYLVKWMCALGTVALCCGYVGVVCAKASGRAVADEIRRRYLQSILTQSMRWVDKHNPLTLPNQMHADCGKVEDALGEKLLTFCNVASYLAVGACNCVINCPQLAAVVVMLSPLASIGMVLVGYTMTKREALKHKAYSGAGSIAEESITDYKTVAAHCAEDSRIAAYTQHLDSPNQVATKLSLLFGLGWGLILCMWFVITSLLFWYGGVLISHDAEGWIKGNKISVREEIVVFMTVGTSFLYVGNLVPCYQALVEARTAAYRAFKIIDKKHFLPNGTATPPIKGHIQFDNVFFQYSVGKGVPALCGLNFEAKAGQVTALVGESGAGKSTVAQLVERFYDPLVGRILIDGIDLRDLKIEYWRSHIGLVSQEPILFNISLYDNIALGRKDATAKDVFEAARLASALPFIQSLELGFHTMVGVKGRLLSGGQRQRVALARALVRNPSLLILDEATSSLDNKCEMEVQEALDRLLAEQRFTAIIIAQRLSTVKHADHIVVMRGGKNAEEGTHESLLRSNGIYHELVNGQGAVAVTTSPVQQVTNSVTVAYPSVDPVKNIQKASSGFALWKLIQLIGNNKCWLVVGCVSAALAGLNYPGYGYLVARQISATVSWQGNDLVSHCQVLAAFVITISLGAFIFTTIMSVALGRVTANVTSSLRKSAFQAILYQEAAYHDDSKHSPSTLIQTLESDCEHVSAAGGPLLGSLLMLTCAIVAGSYIGITHSFKLGLVNSIMSPLLFFGLVRGYVMQAEGRLRPEIESANALLSDSVANLRIIHAYNIADDLQTRYNSQLQLAASSKGSLHIAALTYGVSVSLLYYVFSVSFWYGSKLVRDEGLDYENECTAIFAPFMGAMGVTVAVVFAPDISAGSKAVSRLFEVIEYQSSITATDPTGLRPKINGQIEFRDVLFAYPHKATPVLQGVSFKVPAGSSLGITGSSGSGKSTIVQLLLRFYDVTAGDIFIDRVPIKYINVRFLRESIAVVGQEPVLFTGSIRDNVSFGNEKNSDDNNVIAALEQAQAFDFVQKHPAGLDRAVGIRGSGLSGGQKQRIAIARAIHRNPKILILDESTSALDTKTERLLQQTMGAVTEGRTCIIVAHRLGTIKACDQIMVVEEGRIREAGRHEELMRREGSLYAAQVQHSEKRCKVN